MNLPLSRDGSSSFRESTPLTVFSSVCSDASEGGRICAAESGMVRDIQMIMKETGVCYVGFDG